MEVSITEYSQTAAALGELRQKYENVVFPVDTTAGMKDAVSARRELRDIRVGLEKMRKDLKEPALRRCQLIDSEAKTITAQLTALEDPIDAQIKAEERRKEELRREAERREQERIEAIQEKIHDIRNLPWHLRSEPVVEIEIEIEALKSFEPGEEFQEFIEAAKIARDEAIAELSKMHAEKVLRDEEAKRLAAEQEKLRAEREELERMKRDLERSRAEAARIDSVAERIGEEMKVTAGQDTIVTKNGNTATSVAVDGDVITAEPVAIDLAAIKVEEGINLVPDFVHRTRIERHRNYPKMAVEFALGPANIALTFDGDTGVLKAAEVL